MKTSIWLIVEIFSLIGKKIWKWFKPTKGKATTKDKKYLELAIKFASESTCIQTRVGAILVKYDKIISMGWKGAPDGIKRCTGKTCMDRDIDKPTEDCRGISAISSCLLQAGSGKAKKCTIYVSKAPTLDCAVEIIYAGVKKVVFWDEIIDVNVQKILEEARVQLVRVKSRTRRIEE